MLYDLGKRKVFIYVLQAVLPVGQYQVTGTMYCNIPQVGPSRCSPTVGKVICCSNKTLILTLPQQVQTKSVLPATNNRSSPTGSTWYQGTTHVGPSFGRHSVHIHTAEQSTETYEKNNKKWFSRTPRYCATK